VSVSSGETDSRILNEDYGIIRYLSLKEDPRGFVDYIGHFCWASGQAGPQIDYGTSHCSSKPFVDDLGECAIANPEQPAFCPLEFYGKPLIDRLTGHSTLDQTWGPTDVEPYPAVPDYMQRVQQMNLSGVLNNVAASLTDLGLAPSNRTSIVTGSSQRLEVYVRVDWPWLILPATLEVAGLCVLVLTALLSKRKRVRLWKSSALALLYHGLEVSFAERRPLENVYDMQRVAEKTNVRLDPSLVGERTALLAIVHKKQS
jgi:hypothetical protein